MVYDDDDQRTKKERSPSFPFISLPRALDRAQAFYAAHRREPTRLGAVGETWSYSPASSGLQQTVAALKQFGLLDELRGEGERKVQISELARKIIADQRPGAREHGIQEAAIRPKLIEEYVGKWVPDRPSDTHCTSELEFEKKFNPPAARLFLKVFDETVAFAGLSGGDKVQDGETGSAAVDSESDGNGRDTGRGRREDHPPALTPDMRGRPLSERLQVVTTGSQLTVSAALVSGREVDKLIRILEANKMLLDDEDDASHVQNDQEPSRA